MNYFRIYNNLIEKSKNRKLTGYFEVHHIIPRCMGGSNDKENLAELTPEEHFLAHQLLTKMYPKNYGLMKAAAMMTVGRTTNKMYGWLRKRLSVAMSISQTGKNNSQYGKIWMNYDGKIKTKIPQNLIEEYISQGWSCGRTQKYGLPELTHLKMKQNISRIKDTASKSAYSLLEKFCNGNYDSITDFALEQNCTSTNISQKWSKYVIGYKEYSSKNMGKKKTPENLKFLLTM